MLLAFLASNDAECPECSYNLRGVTLPSCPECDSEIVLSVASVQPRLGPWLMAWLAFAMAVGFDFVVGILMMIPTVMFGGGDWLTVVLLAMLSVLGTLSAIGLWILVTHMQSWTKMARRRQWFIAQGIFLMVI
jgi:hypothetical protein